MTFPFCVLQSLDEDTIKLWEKVYQPSIGTFCDKTIEESIWRRTQNKQNKSQSLWKSDSDKRRKLFHYIHRFGLRSNADKSSDIVLLHTHIKSILTLPSQEIDNYLSFINSGLKNGKWEILESNEVATTAILGDLIFKIKLFKPASSNPEEIDEFNDDYCTIDMTFSSKDTVDAAQMSKQIWSVLKSGMRKKPSQGNPRRESTLSSITKYFPAQLEIGCGPAFEAGVPALHDLHHIYSINQPHTKEFIFNAAADKFLFLLLNDPNEAFSDATDVFKKIINAKITGFYKAIKMLFELKHLVGPIITNNFDGIHLRLDLQETFVRRYEDNLISPLIYFHPQAKSLLVVGCHADRRGIQAQARNQGLKVILVDPEGWNENGKFYSYPLEAQDDGDLIINDTASYCFEQLIDMIKKNW